MRVYASGATVLMMGLFGLGGISAAARGADLQVKIENLSTTGGLFLTPFWVGFHNGGFDLYDAGSAASAGLERLAEDGDAATLRAEFAIADSAGQDGVIIAPEGFADAPVFDPQDMASMSFSLNTATQRYFSFAAMVIPSNDAFIANGDPIAYELFDASGNFRGPIMIDVMGSMVLDAGTEDNTEMEAAFLNQTGPNQGTATVGGVVGTHPGFIGSLGNPGGSPLILGATSPAGFTFDSTLADFTRPAAQIARITITAIPEPAAATLGLVAAMGSLIVGRRRRE